jgi:hypothetical protein
MADRDGPIQKGWCAAYPEWLMDRQWWLGPVHLVRQSECNLTFLPLRRQNSSSMNMPVLIDRVHMLSILGSPDAKGI